MADASTVAGAAKSIGSALVTEAKYLYGVEDEVRALKCDLVCMQQFLQDVDTNPNLLKQDGQLRILADKMRELAFQAEDAIDTYLVDVGSKIYNKNFLLKFMCMVSHSYSVHMLRKEIETIQQEIKAAMSRSENKGKQFVSELAQRYIIQVKKGDHQDEIEYIKIHDLMREFCLKKASDCQFLEYISSTHSYGKRSNKPRRVSIFSRDHCLEENSYLRTIVYRGLSDESGGGVLGKLESIHKDFKLLRVLMISKCANKTLPSKIGSLIHLTYLSITYTEITELPESVRNLRNLIVLEFITTRERVLKIPNDLVGNMENLGVLVLYGTIKCNRIGLNSEKHKKLLRFQCGAGRWMTQELPSMHLLTLRVQCVFNNADVSKELKFNTEKLMGGQTLHNLYLVGRLVNNFTIQFPANLVCIILSRSEIGEGVDLMEVLGQLSKLKVRNFGKTPTWVRNFVVGVVPFHNSKSCRFTE